MTRELLILPVADGDLREIVSYLRMSSEAVAMRFYDSALSTIEQIRNTPEIGTQFEVRSVLVRVRPIRQFRSFLIFYQVSSARIEVIRVLHGARDWPSLFTS